jgi:basic membrane lipoprotein Med (substrate-binding protein (PBP1-ABC) superfamily)
MVKQATLSRRGITRVAVLLAIFAAFAGLLAPKAQAATTSTDVVVYVGQLGATTYEQSLNGVLYTENQIGLMANNILWTESQIGAMADRIVYVTQFSQDNTIQVIYMVTALTSAGTSNGGYLYNVLLTPVAALPAGW